MGSTQSRDEKQTWNKQDCVFFYGSTSLRYSSWE